MCANLCRDTKLKINSKKQKAMKKKKHEVPKDFLISEIYAAPPCVTQTHH